MIDFAGILFWDSSAVFLSTINLVALFFATRLYSEEMASSSVPLDFACIILML